MASEELKSNDEAQIRQLIGNWAKALGAKDVDGLMANYAPDLVLFNLAPPLQYNGVDAYRKIWEEWLPTFQGPVGYEIHDLSITAGAEVAFCHSLTRIGGITPTEKPILGLRATVCYRKIDGTWMVTHEHVSVPFYMDPPFKAAVDLKP